MAGLSTVINFVTGALGLKKATPEACVSEVSAQDCAPTPAFSLEQQVLLPALRDVYNAALGVPGPQKDQSIQR